MEFWSDICILYLLMLFNARAQEGEKGMKRFCHIYPRGQVVPPAALKQLINRGIGRKVPPREIIMRM